MSLTKPIPIEPNFSCSYCGKQSYLSPYRIRNGAKFCGYSCRSLSQRTNNGHTIPGKRNIPKVIKETLPKSCLICGFSRAVQYAHIIPVSVGGITHINNIVVLCPNHHVLFDSGKLLTEELFVLKEKIILANQLEKCNAIT